MFRLSSWIQRAGVVLLLFASLGVAAVAPPHADDRDADCSPVPVAHDESAHYIGAASGPAPVDGDHCFLCHSLRSFYSAFDKYEHHHDGPRAERLHVAPFDRAFIVDWTLVPGRAPPV